MTRCTDWATHTVHPCGIGTSFLLLVLFCLACTSWPAAAQVHQWLDAQARLHITDAPPPQDAIVTGQRDTERPAATTRTKLPAEPSEEFFDHASHQEITEYLQTQCRPDISAELCRKFAESIVRDMIEIRTNAASSAPVAQPQQPKITAEEEHARACELKQHEIASRQKLLDKYRSQHGETIRDSELESRLRVIADHNEQDKAWITENCSRR